MGRAALQARVLVRELFSEATCVSCVSTPLLHDGGFPLCRRPKPEFAGRCLLLAARLGWPENTVPSAMIKRPNYPHRPATLNGGSRLSRPKIKRNKANQNRIESNRTGYQNHERIERSIYDNPLPSPNARMNVKRPGRSGGTKTSQPHGRVHDILR